MSAFDSVRSYVSGIVEAQWSQVLLPTEWEGHKGSSKATWGRWSIQEGLGEPAALYGLITRHIAILTLQIFTPEHSGTRIFRQCADALAGIFELKQFSIVDASSKPIHLRFEAVGLVALGVIDRTQTANAQIQFVWDHHRA